MLLRLELPLHLNCEGVGIRVMNPSGLQDDLLDSEIVTSITMVARDRQNLQDRAEDSQVTGNVDARSLNAALELCWDWSAG